MRLGRDLDTICAVATPHGVGGISVIRVCGPMALKSCRPLMPFLPAQLESHKIYFGRLLDRDLQTLDEVLVSFFSAGKSFTGDETLEISCHGNPRICERILEEIIFNGARAAERGEFTYRAFQNGKVDLVQAEAVLSVIESQSKSSSRMALRQLKGDLSRRLNEIEDQLTWCLAHIEAGIDFSTEGLDVVDEKILTEKLQSILDFVSRLTQSYSHGRLIKDGVKLVLAGRPNVGKSSLLNRILGYDRAIVSDIAGTTRDVVDGELSFKGFKFHIFDTAGLREASDQIERIGIQKSLDEQKDADLVLFVVDASSGFTEEDRRLLLAQGFSNLLVVVNKSDLDSEGRAFHKIKDELTTLGISEAAIIGASSLVPDSRELLLERSVWTLNLVGDERDVLLSQARHFENLLVAEQNISKVLGQLGGGIGSEFLAFELKEALMRIQEILGKRFDDQIMDRVFKEFCIGK